ncbi:unnamed protein product [Ceutorhynchus assimilis]|uniref:Pyroglutamyl-peptidase 1 n=1 Tax=Ceutorhynchus assimilis TaxID=467358 RepID=A0A9N9QN65_9CUCU|nr:unnamed protein product [Ceutorhynchus assimilis]
MFNRTFCFCFLPVWMLFAKKKMNPSNNNILVTGFGPFGEHTINASWEAVSILPDKIAQYNIIKKQIPVSYKHVEENVPLLWDLHNPKLVIHVGVSSVATEIQLETCANKTGYARTDIDDSCPAKGQAFCNESSNSECLKTNLNTQTICDRLNQHPQLKASTSSDSGRYLWEFIYYVSLNQNNKNTLFVHVPPLDQPFSKSQLANALEIIIKCALELIEEEDDSCTCKELPRIYKNGRAAAF